MKWIIPWIITAVAVTGCKSSQTSFNTLAPFGSARVPPPPTNQFNASGNYYNRTAPPMTATPTVPGLPAPPASTQPAAATATGNTTSAPKAAATESAWQSSAKSAAVATAAPAAPTVQPASFQTAAGAPKDASAAPAASGSTLRLSGMPVNDATAAGAQAAPAPFVPTGSPIEISQLPKSPATSTPTPATGTVVASAQASDQAVPASSQSTLQWKSRP